MHYDWPDLCLSNGTVAAGNRLRVRKHHLSDGPRQPGCRADFIQLRRAGHIMADIMQNVNDQLIVITPHIKIPLAEFRFSFSRSSGPGGQNVNKVNSKVTLHWDVTQSASLPDAVRQRFITSFRNRINAEGELVLYSQRYREQERNRADCLDKLRDLVVSVAVAPKIRRRTRPSRGSRERRLREKHQRSETKSRRRRPLDG